MALKTKIYIALIATGLVALAVDRCFVGASTPASTAAGEVDSAVEGEDLETKPTARPRLVPLQVGSSRLNVPELHFPRNLPVYDPALEMRDVFARVEADDPSPGVGHPGKGPSPKKGQAPDAIGRDAFQSAHRMDAVMVQESLRIAVIDGRWVGVGDVVDTCVLTRIEGDSAVFQCHDGDTVLSPSGKRRSPPG